MPTRVPPRDAGRSQGTAPTLRLPRLRPDQWAIVQHPAREKVVATGRRWGKSTTVGTVAIASASRGAKWGWGAPNYKNALPLWRWAVATVRPLVPFKLATVNAAERLIEFPNGGMFAVFTLDNPDACRGWNFHGFGIDEAARVEEWAWTDVIQPCLADFDGQSFLMSTPKGRNWFWREFQRGREDGLYVKSWSAPTSDNPIPNIQNAFKLAKTRVPKNTYEQEWLAEFTEDALTLFSQDWWDVGQHPERRYYKDAPQHAHSVLARWISWDTAFKDKDDNAYSAAVVFELLPDYRVQVAEVYRDRLNFPRLIQEITSLAHKYRDDKLRGIVIEDKASGTSAYQTIVASTDPWLASRMRAFQPQGSKVQRAAQAGIWGANGSVLLPHPPINGDWQQEQELMWLFDFEEELYGAGPNAPFMDQVDAFSQGVIYLERILQRGFEARQGYLRQVDWGDHRMADAILRQQASSTLQLLGEFSSSFATSGRRN